MATVNKNFRIKHGLIVEGSSATIGGQNVLTETGGDAYILNLVGGATLVKSVDAGVFSVDGAGNLTINENTFDAYGAAAAAQAAAEDNALIKTTTGDFSVIGGQLAVHPTSNIASKNYVDSQAGQAELNAAADATSKANAAQAAAEATAAADATSKANAAQAAAEATAAADATSKANAAQAAAEDYADGLAVNYDPAGSAAAAQAASEEYTDTAVANVVGAAPELLDTLQELAAALENNPDIIADLQDVAAGKQDTLTAGSNIDITGDTISVTGLDTADVAEDASRLYFTDARALTATALAYDAAGAAEDAENNSNTYTDGQITTEVSNRNSAIATAKGEAEDYADSLAVNYDAAGAADAAETAAATYTDGQIENLTTGVNGFTLLNLNDEAVQIAASVSSPGSLPAVAYQWNKADYRSAKFLVRIDNGTHNEISEILLTLDSSDNVAITEYAIVGTNGSRGAITAEVSGANVRVVVVPVNDSTIKITGTLLV